MAVEQMVEIDVDGTAVSAPREVVSALAAAAAARAGVSERHRELSLLLGGALESGHVSLVDGSLLALRAVLEEGHGDRFGSAGAELRRAVTA